MIVYDSQSILNLLQSVIISKIQSQDSDINNWGLGDEELVTEVNHLPPEYIPAHFVMLHCDMSSNLSDYKSDDSVVWYYGEERLSF